MSEHNELREDSKKLADELIGVEPGGAVVSATLSTDEKVIARITDGIYRQPASALRELISNAYDADATSVTIHTDYPRFEQITVRDNGIGMGEKALANLIRHIGGSAKRGSLGMEIGVTDPNDGTKTISGRNIIGKIGIGLFSVAQLTQQFQIITKVAGSNFRLVADVVLKTYSEDELLADSTMERFESGRVEIKKVKAADIEAHGTDIVLMNLRKNALSILRSEDVWSRVEEAENDKAKLEYTPTYHIGKYEKDKSGAFNKKYEMNLPWKDDVEIEERFKKVYSSVLDELGHTRATPRLENTFDNYFQMLWVLALSSPINYIDKHPFQLVKGEDEPLFFVISNKKKEQVSEDFATGDNYKEYFDSKKIETNISGEFSVLKNPIEDPLGGFDVFIDGLKLYRPLSFNNQKKSKSSLQTPLMFYGRYHADFGDTANSVTGGELEFEAYFFWNSKILPLDHNGISVRINNASGTLFDSRWLGYPVAERTTLGQISAEVFVVRGLDSALNIDRESFNYSHPHYQIMSKWVHNALRQITAKQKKMRSEVNKAKSEKVREEAIQNLYLTDAAVRAVEQIDSVPEIVDNTGMLEISRSEGITSFLRKDIFPKRSDSVMDEKLKLIVAIMESKGLLSELSYSEQEDLVRDIAEILAFGA